MSKTRKEIIEALKELLEQDVMTVRDQVEHLKTQFYTSDEEAKVEDEEAKGEEVTGEGLAVNEEETEFKSLLAQYKAKRAEVAAAQAKEEEANQARKQAILDEMAKMVESGDAEAVMGSLQRMRELQAEWKAIGPVPVTQTQALRKAYQQYQEQFYDLVKINIELRDLDFKKNLELKTLLCEAAERLQNNDNIVEASRALQQLHDEWSEIGPVARELREELWERFKAASTVINKKHQAYFDALHAKEKENLERKQALVDQLKELNDSISDSLQIKEWDALTEKVQAIQTEWRTIGFAPKKQNQAIYDAYRAECDRFFGAKKAFFQELRERRKEREQRHKEYLERVKAREERQREREEQLKKMAAKGTDSLRRLRDRLQQEIKIAENNILFFTAKSKTANKLVDSMQKKIDELKNKLAEIQAQMDREDE